MIMKTSATLLLSLCCLLASCAGGRARSLHVEGDLCDIDLDYLKTSAKLTHTSGAETAGLRGFEHRYRHTIGLGVISYATDYGSWDTAGDVQRWSTRFGLGAGLLLSHYESRAANGATQRGTKLLRGLIGYTNTSGAGADYLHLLWITIPLN